MIPHSAVAPYRRSGIAVSAFPMFARSFSFLEGDWQNTCEIKQSFSEAGLLA